MSEIDWIRGFIAGSLTVVFIGLMVCIILVGLIRKGERKDPSDWWKRGEEPPQYN